ncbi:MAG: transglutaminase family protein [Pseudomonadota bacterium]|nr:transglutaminase family protein [Pseudomonadota bacterium]
MRIRIDHETRYHYDTPVRGVSQILRLKPRAHDGQHVLRWTVDVDVDGRLREGGDAFGNVVTLLGAEGPLETMTLTVQGEVETTDTNGVLHGLLEPLPPEVFMRDTPLTAPNAALMAFATEAVSGTDDRLEQLHRLLGAVHGQVAYDTRSTTVATSAVDAFTQGRGVCQDLSHIFIASARHVGIPARYVSGHLARSDGVIEQEASHAWAEARVPGLGWVGFDPTNGACPGERHVRIACGFDYLSAAPVRGSRTGGGGERLSVRLAVSQQPMMQSQSTVMGSLAVGQTQR